MGVLPHGAHIIVGFWHTSRVITRVITGVIIVRAQITSSALTTLQLLQDDFERLVCSACARFSNGRSRLDLASVMFVK